MGWAERERGERERVGPVDLGRACGAERGHGQWGCGRSGAEEFGREVEERKVEEEMLMRGPGLSAAGRRVR